MPVDIDVSSHLDTMIHVHVLERNVRGTNMCPVLLTCNALRQSHKANFILFVRCVACPVTSPAVIAFEM